MSLELSSNMIVREVMSSPVISVDKNEDIVQVANKMREQRVGAVVVLNQNSQPVGIVTERDVVTRVVADGLSPSIFLAGQVMSSPLKMVDPEMNLMDAMKMMDKENIRRLGVIYKDELVGVVTDRNIIRFIPTIIDILKEQKEILSNEPIVGSSIVGYCDRCEVYSSNLRNLDGVFLCEDCQADT